MPQRARKTNRVIRDPVCLMTLDPRRAAVMVEHSGQTYYFCSEGCKQKFLAQPDLFLNKATGMRLTVGLMGREVTNIRSSDMVVIVGGRSGTLGEFAIAYDEGKLIGVLAGSGGITGHLPENVKGVGDKNTGARLVYDADPAALIRKLADIYIAHHYKRPSCFCQDVSPADG